MMHRQPYPEGTNLSGQTSIVTGSNSGLGFESSRQMLQLGLSHLIMAVRSQARGDAAADKLRKEFPNSTISVWILDMASYDSIKAFAKKCETLPRIDSVILNAGLRSDEFTILKSTQHEMSYTVNYLSTCLLTILLLPILKSKRLSTSQPPRISIVSSDTFYWAALDMTGPILAQFDKPELFDPMRNYSGSKLVQLFFVRRLTQYVNSDDVIVNVSNPGLCKGTGFGSSSTTAARLFFFFFAGFNGRTVEAGASALVDAVVMKGKESHGSYVSDWTIQPYSSPFPFTSIHYHANYEIRYRDILYTEEGKRVEDRIWEETMEELNFAGASKILQEMKR